MASRGYRYSFSGADAKAYVYYDKFEELIEPIESLHTLSISVHEAKGQGRAFGHRGITGVARGIRTIAGSMILTVVEDHPLRVLTNMYAGAVALEDGYKGWSLDRDLVGTGTALNNFEFTNRLVTILPPFNILTEFVSEGAQFNRGHFESQDIRVPRQEGEESSLYGTRYEIPGAAMLLKGIEFIDIGMVISTHDIVSEVTLSFIAHDFKPISRIIYGNQRTPPPFDKSSTLNRRLQKNLYGTRARDYRRRGKVIKRGEGEVVHPDDIFNLDDIL